jgi:uncharacterized membrane protein YcfT
MDMSVNKERLGWLDIARGGSILLIVMFHATDWLAAYDSSPSIYTQLNLFFRPIRVPIFFLVSGILASDYMDLSWRVLFKRRILPLIYAYVLWGTLNWYFFRHYDDGVHKIAFGENLFQLISLWYSPMIGLWFIWSLPIYIITTKMIIDTSSVYSLPVASFVSILFFTNYFESLSVPHTNLFWYYIFFYVGAKFKEDIILLVHHQFSIVLLTGCAVYMLTGLALLNLPIDYYKSGIFFAILRFILSVSGVATGLGFAFLVNRVSYIGPILRFLGKRTLSIYVVNELFVSIVAYPFHAGLPQGSFTRFIVVPAITLSTIGLALGLKFILYNLGGKFMYQMPVLIKSGAVK